MGSMEERRQKIISEVEDTTANLPIWTTEKNNGESLGEYVLLSQKI